MEFKERDTINHARRRLIDDVIVQRKPVPAHNRQTVRTFNQNALAVAHSGDPINKSPKNITTKPKFKSKSLHHSLITAAFLVFSLGVAASIMTFKTNSDVVSEVKAASLGRNDIQEEDTPSESDLPKGSVNSYKVAPDLPRKISIPKLSVEGRVLALGVKDNNELKAPSNIYDTGWYLSSAKLGEIGATLIDGHASGPTKPGVFHNLKKLVKGDTIKVDRGDGKVFTYLVSKTQVYNQNSVDMAAALVSAEAGKSGLNLITCTGKYNKQTKRYDDRLIVFAVLQ